MDLSHCSRLLLFLSEPEFRPGLLSATTARENGGEKWRKSIADEGRQRFTSDSRVHSRARRAVAVTARVRPHAAALVCVQLQAHHVSADVHDGPDEWSWGL